MANTDPRTRDREHGSEEDWVDFARQQTEPGKRARLEQHLEKGCLRCTRALRLWRAVIDVADQEGAYSPPEETLRQLRDNFTLRRPKRLLERMAERAALVFDSFRQPQPVGVRSAGPEPRLLLYQAGPYTIRVRLEPAADAEWLSIVGQIVDAHDPPSKLQDIAVIALKGSKTLDRTLTNHFGEFVLEADAAEDLRLSIGVAEIGTITVQPPGSERKVRSADDEVGGIDD